MKKSILSSFKVMAALVAFTSLAYAENDCVRGNQASNLGKSLARSVCGEIINRSAPSFFESGSSGQSCRIADVAICKAAMSSYLENSSTGRACARMINRDVELLNEEGEVISSARRAWRQVSQACNLYEPIDIE